MHPFGSGRWRHVLELNAQVSIRKCSDEAQYLKAFKRHKVEQRQRAHRQLDADKENRDSDDDPLARMMDTEEEDASIEAEVAPARMMDTEEDDESTTAEVTALEAKVTRLRAELKEHTEKSSS